MTGGRGGKAGVIGLGHVGSHVALNLMAGGLFRTLIAIDPDADKARANAADLNDMRAHLAADARVEIGSYQDLADAEMVFLCACGQYFREDRLEELADSLLIAEQIAGSLARSGFSGLVLSITNPCDIIAQYMAARTGLNVIGTGTALDSARLRARLADALGVAPEAVWAICVGEHGDSQVPLLSSATVAGLPLDAWCARHGQIDRQAIERDVICAGANIARGKQCTEFGIGAAAARLARQILRDERQIVPCSTMLRGEYGVRGVYASVPCLVGARGVLRVEEIEMSAPERARFLKSCEVLRAHLPERLRGGGDEPE